MAFALDDTEDDVQKLVDPKIGAFILAMKETMLIVNNFVNTMPFTLEIEDVDKFIETCKKIKDFDDFLYQKASTTQP